jgi:hypothetical protein
MSDATIPEAAVDAAEKALRDENTADGGRHRTLDALYPRHAAAIALQAGTVEIECPRVFISEVRAYHVPSCIVCHGAGRIRVLRKEQET